jgi:hypothetical protein
MKTNIKKSKHGAGGFILSLSESGNTRFGESKKRAIIEALQDSWTEAVYITTRGKIKRQLLNGSCEFI